MATSEVLGDGLGFRTDGAVSGALGNDTYLRSVLFSRPCDVLAEPEDLGIPTKCYTGIEKIGGGVVELTLEIPDEATDHIPILFAHGCGTDERDYANQRNYCARNGKLAVTYTSVRNQSWRERLSLPHILNPDKLLAQAVWGTMRHIMQSSEIAEATADDPITEFDLNGHSNGCKTALTVCLRKPEHVRTVILEAPNGLAGDSFWDIASRMPGYAIAELLPVLQNPSISSQDKKDIVLDRARYVAKDPVRFAMEFIAAGNTDIRKQLRQVVYGKLAKTAYVGFRNDSLTPVGKTMSSSAGLTDLPCVFPLRTAGHNAPQNLAEQVAAFKLRLLAELHQGDPLSPDIDTAA